MQCVRIPDRAVDAKRSRPYRLKSRGRDRVATGVQCDVVSECDQLFGEPMNHTLCTAIKPGGYGLRQRRNLGNVHVHDLRWFVTFQAVQQFDLEPIDPAGRKEKARAGQTNSARIRVMPLSRKRRTTRPGETRMAGV